MKQWLVNLPKKYWTTAHILWAVVVFGLHALPSKAFPKITLWENLGPDKIVHVTMFFIGSSLAFLSGWGRIKSVIIWTYAGVLLEYYQFFYTIDRFFDWFDVLADAIGVVLSIWFLRNLKQ